MQMSTLGAVSFSPHFPGHLQVDQLALILGTLGVPPSERAGTQGTICPGQGTDPEAMTFPKVPICGGTSYPFPTSHLEDLASEPQFISL